MTAADKPRADLVALLLQFEVCAEERASLYLIGDVAGAAIRAWCDLRGHRLDAQTHTRVSEGKTIGWTYYTVQPPGGLPLWTVTCSQCDDHEVTAPPARADQQVLARVQAALDGEPAEACNHRDDYGPTALDGICMLCGADLEHDEDGNRIMDSAEIEAREGIEQPEAAEGSV